MRRERTDILKITKITRTIILIFFIILNIAIMSNTASADSQQLNIYKEPDIIYENEQFIVRVFTIEGEYGNPVYHNNTDVYFNNQFEHIDETTDNNEITFIAPEVDSDTYFDISATKTGYKPANSKVLIRNNESANVNKKLNMEIILNNRIVHPNEEFEVQVIDSETRKPVQGASISIGSSSEVYDTNKDGIAFLIAPNIIDEFPIVVEKDGYNKATTTYKVTEEPPLWTNPNFPIVLAVIILVSAIIFVNYRQKRTIYSRATEISKEKLMQKQGLNPGPSDKVEDSQGLNKVDRTSVHYEHTLKPVRVAPKDNGSRVEEIRISRPKPDKEVFPVKPEDEEKAEKVIEQKKNKTKNYEWFEGTDDARYSIDRITGEIDEEGLDKWFEGVEKIKKKIDERVKKKDKKKEEPY